MRRGLLSPEVKFQLPFVSPDSPIYRIGRAPDPWRLPDWATASDDGTFGHRFDDSERYFRVVYAGSTRLGCFIETLARYRSPGPQVLAELGAIANVCSDHTPTNTVPASWFDPRRIGRAFIRRKRFADVYRSEWLSFLQNRLDPELLRHAMIESGEHEFDLAVLMSKRRRLTQRLATLVYQCGYDGIYYQSRYGTDLFNFAIFEPFALEGCAVSEISVADPDLQTALARLALKVGHR